MNASFNATIGRRNKHRQVDSDMLFVRPLGGFLRERFDLAFTYYDAAFRVPWGDAAEVPDSAVTRQTVWMAWHHGV